MSNFGEISTTLTLTDLYNFWFPNSDFQEFWFDGSKDYEIQEKFSSLLKKYESIVAIELYDNWDKSDLKQTLSLIILLDQITRNIARIEHSDYKRNDKYVLEMSNFVISNMLLHTYQFNEKMFILLPFRHSRITHNLNLVINQLNMCPEKEQTTKMFKNFRLATLKDYSKVTDTIKTIKNYTTEVQICTQQINNYKIDEMYKLYMLVFSLFNFFNYLFGKYFKKHTNHNSHPIYDSSIHDKLCCYSAYPVNHLNLKIQKNKLYHTIESFVLKNKIKNIAVSLSGGVDSNVMLFILNQLKLEGKIDLVIAIHVDYGNRDVSHSERDYLQRVCEFFKIPFVVRTIEHIKKSDINNLHFSIDRSFYEQETKNIRFGLYKYAIEKYNIQGICLGHHKDDLIENVFMNIMRDKDFLDLFVMTTTTFTDGVILLRPMLLHHKTEIYDFAHNNFIMYFKDTTSDNCFRGVIRRKIFPQITNFDPHMMQSLLSIGKKSDNWRCTIDGMLIEPILSTLYKGNGGFVICFPGDISKSNEVFLSRLFVKIFHSQHVKMMSGKNIKAFVDWSRSNGRNETFFKTSNGFLVCNIKNKLYFFLHSKLKIFETCVFLYNDLTKIIGTGSWTITIEPTNEFIRKPMSFDDIIEGKFVYTEAINQSKIFRIVQTVDKHDFTKKIFKNMGKLNQYIPKCTSWLKTPDTIFSSTEFVKITLNL